MATKPAALTAEQKAFLEEVGKEVVKRLDGMFFEVEGTPLVSVRYKDGTYKKKTLIAGWEFSIVDAYVGVRPQLNFRLSPEDAQEYEFAEMTAKDLDYYFPFVGAEVGKQFGIEGENLVQLLDQIVINKVTETENKAEREKQEAEAAYKDNDTFGMF